MEAVDEATKFRQVVEKVDPAAVVINIQPLVGGISAQTTVVDFAYADGRTGSIVVRRHGPRDLAHNPNVARDEYLLLRQLYGAGFPVPRPYFYDHSGDIFSTPYIVLAFVDGQPEFAPRDTISFLHQSSEMLAAIHRFDISHTDLSFLARYGRRLDETPIVADTVPQAGRVGEALASFVNRSSRNELTLLHGDYWPGNLLWKDGALVAVIDWENAAIGDPMADVANFRLELLWALGEEAMATFTAYYRTMTSLDFSSLPYWDLYATLHPLSTLSQWGLDDKTEQAMRAQLDWFVEQALQALPRQSP